MCLNIKLLYKYCVQSTGTYRWSDGWIVTFTKWGKNEPQDGPGRGCVSMNNKGFWNNTECDRQLQYVCRTTNSKSVCQ